MAARADLDPARLALDLLARQLDCPRDALRPETRLVEDLGADSFDLIVLAHDLERALGREITDEEGARLLTVGDVLRVAGSAGRSR